MSLTDAAIVVPIDLISPNSWNPNVQPDWIYQKELKSISKYGFVDPLTVREIHAFPEGVTSPTQTILRYELIDGEHRWRAAKELGFTELPCWNLGLIDDADARELTIVLNETRGQPDQERLRAVLKDLVARRGGDETVRDIMPFSRERFDALIGSMKVDWGALEERRQANQAQGRWKEIVFRVPYETAQTIERAIDEVKDREGFDEGWRALEMICADRLAR